MSENIILAAIAGAQAIILAYADHNRRKLNSFCGSDRCKKTLSKINAEASLSTKSNQSTRQIEAN